MNKDIEELITEIYKLIDYSICMQMATGYKAENKFNYLYLIDMIEKFQKVHL